MKTKPEFNAEPHRKSVEMMSAAGITHEDIATAIGCCRNTLEKHFRTELDTALTRANAKVAAALFNKATGDGSQAVTAAIFWLKTRAQWRTVDGHEITGKDGGPIQTEAVLDVSKLDDDALKAIIAARIDAD